MKNYKDRECIFPNCNEVFTPNQASNAYCGKIHEVVCESCSVNKVFGKTLNKWSPICRSCKVKKATELRRKTTRNLYGVEHISQLESVKKSKLEKSLQKYGVANPSQAEVVKELKKASAQRRYGVDNVSQAEEVQLAKKETLLKNYGVDNPQKSQELKEKASRTQLDRYGGRGWSSPELMEKIRATHKLLYGGIGMAGLTAEKIKKTNLERYGVETPFESGEIQKKVSKTMEAKYERGESSHSRISQINKQWAKRISSLSKDILIEFEPSLSKSASADLKVESLLIDVNPTFTHNSFRSFRCIKSGCESIPCAIHPVAADRHFKRAQLALEQDISYIQIYDWDEPEKIIRFLKGKLEKGWKRHSARKLELRSITVKEANIFLEENHIQGGVRGQSHRYGLFNSEELIAVATFGAGRFKSKVSHEWLRYAVKAGNIVHGGAGRLWQAFLAEVEPRSVISYIDFDHSTRRNTFFSSIDGWSEGKLTGPAKVWSKGDKRIYNNSLIRQGADRLLGTSYGSREESGVNNEQIMLLEGWLPVYTAGNRVFLWESSKP